MASLGQTNLRDLARRLVRDGPVKTVSTSRRIRILFNGAIIADSQHALYVWEHEYYPQFYLPMGALVKPNGFDVDLSQGESFEDDHGRIIGGEMRLTVGRKGSPRSESKTLSEIILFASDLQGPASGLRDYLKVSFNAVDQWFEEDTPIHVHPKDPFKRVDILQSTRAIRIAVDGQLVAESPVAFHLYETSLPTRYYLPLTSINTSILQPSSTKTRCPYKGEAQYYNVVLPGSRPASRSGAGVGIGNGLRDSKDHKEYKDIVWYYSNPTVECSAIAGMCCFYNEKVDIWLQPSPGGKWEKLEQPTTHFA